VSDKKREGKQFSMEFFTDISVLHYLCYGSQDILALFLTMIKKVLA